MGFAGTNSHDQDNGGYHIESHHLPITVNFNVHLKPKYVLKLNVHLRTRYVLEAEEKDTFNTSSLFSCFAKIAQKRRYGHMAEGSTARRKGRKRKTKPNDECCDSEVTIPQRYNLRGRAGTHQNNSNAITTEQGGASAEGSTACRNGRKTKTKPKDEPYDSEQHENNSNTITTEQGKLDSSTVRIGGASAEGISKESSCPTSSTARRKGSKAKIEPKDECCGTEVTTPRRTNLCGRAMRPRNNSNTIATERGKLDSSKFLHYFMHIWSTLPKDKVKYVSYFDPLWFSLYAHEHTMVLKWIKGKAIFSMKYVLVPIVIWSHWSLLIFCNLGEPLHLRTSSPCMLLLDSLHALGPTRLEPTIRRLLFDMHQSNERAVSKEELRKIPLLIPKVPQQISGEECGFYVLYYIKLFLETAPENFNISSGYPYFMKEDWFSVEGVESFYKSLDDVPIVVTEDDDDDDDVDDDSIILLRTSHG